ncbi:MAG: hypothetical protein QY306_15360 [Anaerolineales bacterium]|nr:MAG: hypothetical protein QY306_15360 [Anaerolineales bacterium]
MKGELKVEFKGPFSWLGTDNTETIFDASDGKLPGIYLWTTKITDGELIYYVGLTTRSFSQRSKEHFKEHFSGFYHLCSPKEFSLGEKIHLWNGMYGSTSEKSLTKFVERYGELSSAIVELAKVYRFYIAPLSYERRILERIEGGLANHLYNQPGKVGEFQEKGVNYRPRWETEIPLNVEFRCSENLLGLPDSLDI